MNNDDTTRGNPAGDRDGAEGASGDVRLACPPDARKPRLAFPVVGVGASAGGLEAYTELVQALPADAGAAWVLIQHLPPDRESMVAEILARHCPVPVAQVEDGQAVEPNHVYVIRPGHTLTIKDGRLRLGAVLEARGHGRPVDDFFRSLAEEQQQLAIAVVLSGMGSNGSAGAEAVKAVGGLCIAHDPESAKYPSMPRSLIDNNLADYVLRPAEIPAAVVRYAQHPYAADPDEEADRRDRQPLADVLAVLRSRTRHDFTGYRKPTLLRRIQRRMGLAQLESMGEYTRLLRQTPGEVQALADDLLIHVTGFFRDPEAWDALREKVIEPMAADRPDGSQVRCWVAACATGEEAYSLAMLLLEAAAERDKRWDVKVFATDMAERALGHARAGLFPNGIESEVSPERLARFFDHDDGVYRVKRTLREAVIFAPQNILQDPPFSRLDIATCRNMLIYLEPDTQKRVLALLHFGIREGGTLMLGTTESASIAGHDFEPIDKKHRLYRRVGPTRHGSLDIVLPHFRTPEPVRPAEPARLPRPPVAQAAQRLLLEYFSPAAVVVDANGEVIYFHGDTAPYLDQPRGEPTRDLLTLANEQVRGAVRTALQRAVGQERPVLVRDGLIDTPLGRRRVEVGVVPLDRRPGSTHYLVTFASHPEAIEPVALPADAPAEARLAEELRRVQDELQSTIEELQTSNEELKASHEEVTSINEELQSTNEELETSKEELQSLNEELVTVNAQLQAKMGELEATSNDLASLLASTDIAVLFLDTRFRIRRYTPSVKDLLDLIPSDVGRPLADLRWKFADPDLAADAQAVLARLVPVERELQSESGNTYLRRVLPYRTQDHRIDGVVLTFVDITERHRATQAVRASEEQFRRAIEDAPIPVIMQAEDGQVLQVSRSWTELTGYALADVPTAEAWLTRAYGPGADAVRAHMHELFRGGRKTLDVEFALRTKVGLDRHWSFSASAPGTLQDGRRFLVGMAVDITERRRAEEALAEERVYAEKIVDTLHEPLLVLHPDLTVKGVNPAFYTHFGVNPTETVGRKVYELGNGQWDIPALRMLLEDVLPDSNVFNDYEVTHEFETLGRRVMLVNGRRLDHVQLILLGIRDITERSAAEEALRESEERLRLALAAARMGIWTLDGETGTQMRDVNLNALLGLEEVETTQPFAEFFTHIYPDDRPVVEEAFARSLKDHQPLNIEFRVVRPDGRVRWLRDQGDVFHTAGGNHMAGACVDITDLKAAESAVRASEERLRLILESATDFAIITLAPDRTITSWSPGAEATFGYTEAEIVGQPADVIFTPEDRAAGVPEEEAEQARRLRRAADERWHLRKDGNRLWASGTLTPLAGREGGFVKVLRDMTDRKRLADALHRARAELEERVQERTAELAAAVDALETEADRRRELARKLSTAQEAERRRVARDLHDTLGQLQAGLGLAVDAARRAPALPPAADEQLANVQRLVNELTRETHALAVRLRPTALDDLGLEPALRQLVSEFFTRSGLEMDYQTSGLEERLPTEVETAIYRVVQEALTNVTRHARATQVGVAVVRTESEVTATVEDDGVGFDLATSGAGRLGLLGMRERVELVGGSLEVESGSGGTTVYARIPLEGDAHGQVANRSGG